MIIVEVSKNGSWNDLAVGSAAVWIFFYTISLAVATLNVIILCLLVLIDWLSPLKPDESKPLRFDFRKRSAKPKPKLRLSSNLGRSMRLSPKVFFRIIRKPYIFQPLQVLRRLRQEYFRQSQSEVMVNLPWGVPIMVNPHVAIGSNIACQGIYEIAVTETLWRLTDRGDLAIDVGANIGYTATILGVGVGRNGRVLCFEPQTEVFAALARNVKMWEMVNKTGSFTLHQIALGDRDGHAFLHTNDWFRTNRGTAWVLNDRNVSSPDERVDEVPIRTLDSVVGTDQCVGVLKIDVEGGAFTVLQGAAYLLEQHRVRDIVFEDEADFPGKSHTLLQSKGYSIFGLEEGFSRVRLRPNTQPHFDRAVGPTPNYLATIDPERAVARLTPGPWRSFGVMRILFGKF
jgi:FkbM family methyltransferase